MKIAFFDLDGTIIYRRDLKYSYISGMARSELMKELQDEELLLMPYVRELLDLLKSKNIECFVVSNSYEEDVQLVLEHFDLSRYLTNLDTDFWEKGDRIRQVLKEKQISPNEAIFIDNQLEHLSDAEAKNQGLKTVSIKSDIYLDRNWSGKNRFEWEKTFFDLYNMFLEKRL